jgi:transposase
LDRAVAELDRAIQEQLHPFEPHIQLLTTIVGWQRRTAEVFLAETGADMRRFPTPAQLGSWARMCPANRESAGKHKPAGKKPGKTWLGQALTEAARSAANSKGTYLAAKYSRIARRRGPNRAAVAIAHTMLIIARHILTPVSPTKISARTGWASFATPSARPTI